MVAHTQKNKRERAFGKAESSVPFRALQLLDDGFTKGGGIICF